MNQAFRRYSYSQGWLGSFEPRDFIDGARVEGYDAVAEALQLAVISALDLSKMARFPVWEGVRVEDDDNSVKLILTGPGGTTREVSMDKAKRNFAGTVALAIMSHPTFEANSANQDRADGIARIAAKWPALRLQIADVTIY